MSKYSLQANTHFSVRLSCPTVGAVDTLMHLANDGTVVTIRFGVTKRAEEKVSRVDVSEGPHFPIPEVGEEARDREVSGFFTRISAYCKPLVPSARVIRRHSGDTLVIQDVLAVVDALAGEDYLKHEVRRIDVWLGAERLGSAAPVRFGEGTGIAQALLARGVVHEAIVRLKGAPLAKVQSYDDNTLRKIAPLGGMPEGFPSEALAGEAPFGSYTTKVEGRPAAGLTFAVPEGDADISRAFSPLAEVRHPLMLGNLDRKLKSHIMPSKVNIVLTIGTSPGVVGKGLQDFTAAGGRVVGVVAHGEPSLKDTVVLPAGATFGSDFTIAVKNYLGGSPDSYNILAIFFMRSSTEVRAESGEYKLVYANQRLVEEATAFVSTVGRAEAPVVLVLMTDIEARLPDWVNFAYVPANMSLAVPHWMVGVAPAGMIRVGGLFDVLEVDTNRRLTSWVMRSLRRAKIPGGGYPDDGATYPSRFEWTGRGVASYDRHQNNTAPSTSCQAFLLPGEYVTIGARYDRLLAHAKVADQQFGFIKGKDAALAVPIEYHGSLLSNKYLRSQLGAPLPTQSAERVTPLSALFALLDDELYVLMELACYLMRVVGSPFHCYEVAIRVAALGTMTRVDAIAKLASLAADAREIMYGNKTPKGTVKASDLLGYANPMVPFKSTYVTKATWALIQEAQRRGSEKRGGSVPPTAVDTNETAAQSASAAFATAPRGGAGGDRGGRGRAVQRRGGAPRGAAFGPGRGAFAERGRG
jgi:hypothetical protein